MLRGLGGAVIGLPALECFGEVTDKTQAPVRFGAMFMPNGVNPPDWVPKGVGEDFELSPILAETMKSVTRQILHQFALSPILAGCAEERKRSLSTTVP